MSFFGITDFWAYLLGVIAIIILPGPNSMYCLFAASSRGVFEGYKAATAIFIGDLVLMLSAVLGGAVILKTNPTVFFVFKALGGVYLAYLGINLLIGAYKRFKHGSVAKLSNSSKVTEKQNNLADIAIGDTSFNINDNTNADVGVSFSHDVKVSVDAGEHTDTDKATIAKDENVFIKALMLSLSNPKAILFFLSFFLQFVDPNYDNPMLSFLILGVTLQVVSMIYLSILIFAGTKLSAFFGKQYVLPSVGNAIVGLLFISFAVSLWMSRV